MRKSSQTLQHVTQNVKTHNRTTQTTKNKLKRGPHQQPMENLGTREGYAIPASYKTPAVLRIYTDKSSKRLGIVRGKTILPSQGTILIIFVMLVLFVV